MAEQQELDTCPVCGISSTATTCPQCGWDKRPQYGLSSGVHEQYAKILDSAKRQWRANVTQSMKRIAILESQLSELAEQLSVIQQEHKQATEAGFSTTNYDIPEPPELPHEDELSSDGYRDNGDGTVTDLGTGLTWMRFCVGQRWRNGEVIGDARDFSWEDALETPAYFNRVAFAGHRDWRLPDSDELITLVLPHWEGPCCSHVAFPNCPADCFWSSSSNALNSNNAWVVDFNSGFVNASLKRSNYRVRLVRAGQ